jgi:hypothetical protein
VKAHIGFALAAIKAEALTYQSNPFKAPSFSAVGEGNLLCSCSLF